MCTYDSVELTLPDHKTPGKQSGAYRTPKILLSQLFKENQGGGFKTQIQRRKDDTATDRTATSSYGATRNSIFAKAGTDAGDSAHNGSITYPNTRGGTRSKATNYFKVSGGAVKPPETAGAEY